MTPRPEGSTPSSLRPRSLIDGVATGQGPRPRAAEALRRLPSVDRLAVAVARATLAERRSELLDGETAETDLVARARGRMRPSLRRVLNATGVILHTNLGRAPLSVPARAAIADVAAGYSNLELDRATGERGSRHDHVGRLLCELTGAEAALVVNNGAAAVLLGAAVLAAGRELIVSRGQLIEIGGGFRIPEVVGEAGAQLVEVGTTNRTRRDDYAQAIGEQTGAIMRAHPSNFRAVGFVEEVAIEELCRLGVPVLDDVGSGVLGVSELEALASEPPVRRSIAAGAELVCFSGDKLLGGPQAGVIVGRRDAVRAARAHPLARALRIDKLSLAGLEATLAVYRDPERAHRELPVLAMLTADRGSLERRAQRIAEAVDGQLVTVTSRVGGGALPLLELEGPAVAVRSRRGGPSALARRLREGDPAVFTRIAHDRVVLDPRALTDADAVEVASAVRAACR